MGQCHAWTLGLLTPKLSFSLGAREVSGAGVLFCVAGPGWNGQTCPIGLP